MKTSMAIAFVVCGTVLVVLPVALRAFLIVVLESPDTMQTYARYGLLPGGMQWVAFAIGAGMVMLSGVGAFVKARPSQE
jgi:hypothetical protein